MRMLTSLLLAQTWLAQACLAQAPTSNRVFKIPPVKASISLDQQPVDVTLWGTVSPAPGGTFALALTVDLGSFQEHLTPILAAQLNRSDRCGDHLSIEHAVIVPAAPSGLLTANVNFERYGCVNAFGKQISKRLVGGHGVVVVNLTPSATVENDIDIAAEVRKIDADGSLGEVLRSGSFADSIRQKIADSIESSIQKAANLEPALPAAIEKAVSLESVQFADGGSGLLWLTLSGEVQLSAEDVRRAMAK